MTCVPVLALIALATAAYGYPSVPINLGAKEDLQPSHSHKILPRKVSGTSSDISSGASHPDLTQVITSSSSQPARVDLGHHDAYLSEEELQSPRRRRDTVSSSVSGGGEESAEDDSDMFLEPDEEQTGAGKQTANPSELVARYEYGLEPSSGGDVHGHEQHFFPSFAPVFSLGHSRPPQLYHQEPPAYKSRPSQLLRAADFNPFRAYRENAFQAPADSDEEASSTTGLLGSGNFGVIRGGTYYNDEDSNGLNPYYNNGQGKPGYGNPRPQKYNGGDFFANFRDFADINVSPKASFSEYVIVYVNKNHTHTSSDPNRPKNIIEQLSLIDKENEEDMAGIPEKKQSTHKKKLAVYRRRLQDKAKKEATKAKNIEKDLQEPLLALS